MVELLVVAAGGGPEVFLGHIKYYIIFYFELVDFFIKESWVIKSTVVPDPGPSYSHIKCRLQ